MRRKVIYAVLAALAAGAAFYFLFHKPAGPVLLIEEMPVPDGTQPLPPGTTVMPRIEAVFEEAEGADFADLKGDPKVLELLSKLQTSTVPAESSTEDK